MDHDFSYDVDKEQQLWDDLEEVVSTECTTSDRIDNTLRSFLNLATYFRGKYISSEYDIARCSYIILSAPLFEKHEDYVRRQIVYCLLQDEDPNVLVFVTSFLLFDIRESESTAEILNEEGGFPRLVDLISRPEQAKDIISHRSLMELLYEMSRIQQIRPADLIHIDDTFVCQLFELIEDFSNDASDPYHYPIIRVILVLNEQFMVSAHDPGASGESRVLTNKVIKVLASRGGQYKTFGENIILLLNRESETSLQLLTLKLLYLLFTTPSTQEYFYTNDLRVLVDILLRNLLDLPSDATALRHTYLRVLYPLLAHTQLRHSPHYKREEIRKVLAALAGAQCLKSDEVGDSGGDIRGHFEEADGTTKRLVKRCKTVSWLQDSESNGSNLWHTLDIKPLISPIGVISGKKVPPTPPDPRKLQKRNVSNIGSTFSVPEIQSARGSALSVQEVAAQRERPGVMTPSRTVSQPSAATKNEKPLPPQSRRSGWKRTNTEAARRRSEIDPEDNDAGETKSLTVKKGLDDPESLASVTFKDEEHHPPTKAPPPAPKARRWRGKWRQKEEEGVGNEYRADHSRNLPSSTRAAETKVPDVEIEPPRASVAEALSSAHAQAVDSMNDVWQKANMTSSSTGMKTVLAPPSPAPPRGIPGPTLSLERSPFIGENEDL